MRLNFEVLLVALSFWCGIVGSCQAYQTCVPVSTEAVDSVALLHFPVGYQNIKPLLRPCLEKKGPEADFALATILAKGGLYEAAIALLTTPDGKLSGRAALLAADIFLNRAEGNDLSRAKVLFADLATHGRGHAKIGLALTVLATSKIASDREKAVQNLLDTRSTLVLAQLGAALVQAGISSVERARGRQYLEQASAQGEIAAKIELAKLLIRLGPYQDEARAIDLLQPGVSRGNSDALLLAAGLWAQGFQISQREHERYLNEQANILAWSNGLRVEAKRTGNYERAEAAEGYVVERNLEISKLVSEQQDLGKAKDFLSTAALQGHLPSILQLGTLKAFQPTSSSEVDEGIGWLRVADRRGNPQAAERLAVLYDYVLERARGCDLDAQISTMGTAHTFYARAASRGLQRSIVGADRTDERLRMAWMGEIKALCQYTATIDVSPEQGNGKTMVVYARNLPVQSPLFVSERWQQVEIKDNGTQVFGARLNIGDRVRFRNGEILKFEGSNETVPFGRIVMDGQPEVVLRPGDDPFSAIEWPNRTPEPTVGGVTFTAWSGRDNAITLADPDWRLFRLGTADYLGGFFTNDIELFEPKTLAVPAATRIIGLIKGGTDFEIRRDGNLLLRMLVPANLNLYLDFRPDDLSSIFVDTTDAGREHPNEIYAGRVALPKAVLYAKGLPFGRYYSRYDAPQDGVFAMPEFNAPIQAMGAFYRGDSDKELRLLLLSARSKTMHTGGVSLEAIQARAELARPLANMGQLREAIELRSAAVRELQEFEIQPNRSLIEQLNHLAALHQQDNDLSRAIIVARQALALAQGLADPSRKGKPFPDQSYIRSIGLLAELYRQAGEMDRAYLYYQRLIGLDLLGDPEIRTNGNMAAYVALADLALAKGERAVSSAAARFTLPFAKADAGQRDKPDPLQRPITVPDAITRMFGPSESSSIIAQAFLRLGDAYWYASYPWQYSEPVYEAATIGALGSAGPGSALALRSSARLAMVRWMIGKNDGNLDLLRKAGRLGGDQSIEAADNLASAEMPLFNSAFVGTLDWYQDNHFIDESEKFSEAASLFAANERGDSFALSFQLAELHRRAETADQKRALQSWTEAMAALSKLTRQLNSLVEGRGVSASSQLSKTRQELEGRRRAELDAVGTVAKAFGLPNLRTSNVDVVSKLQPLLTDDEVVLDLLPSRYSVAALVITKTTRRIVTFPMTDVDIAVRLKAMRAALDPDTLKLKGYNKIDLPPLVAVRPFTTDLMGPDATAKRSWIIIAHGPLRSLPFEAIPLSADVSDDPDNVSTEAQKWAGLSKQISYLPSLDSLLTLKSGISPSKATQPISVIADPIMPGDPRYAGGFARRLDNVQQNIRYARWSIGTWLGELQPVPETSGLGFRALLLLDGDIQNLFSGRRATRDVILNSRKLEDSKVILFATHGETAESHPEFGEPFLALTPADGSSEKVDPLTASEISTLGLDADLVFLSACATAAPDGTPGQSGFSGLAQAFVSAGARTLVATQWKITTRAADLATGATLRAAQNRSHAASAVMQGRMAVAESFGHPSFWSAFAMVGDPEYDWRFSN